MVSVLESGARGPGSSPGRVTVLGKTLYSTVPLSTQQYKWVPENYQPGKPDEILGDNLRWID